MRSRKPLLSALVLALASQAKADDVEELRKEVRALRSELSGLRLLLSELAELDRQRAQLLTRALDGALQRSERPPPSLPSSPPRVVSEENKAPPAEKPAPSLAPRPSGGGGATISGVVNTAGPEVVRYVYVENVAQAPVRGETVTIEQIRKEFSPGWAVVQKGTTITFPNMDNVYHNVFSRSPGNSFDLGLYGSNEKAKGHTFLNPGPVEIYCNIHPRMVASVLVVPNRHFAKVKPDGRFELGGVPPGKRKVVAWAPGSVPESQWVELGAGGAELVFNLAAKADGHLNKAGRPYGSYP